MARGVRKYEITATQSWAVRGCCKACGQKITSSPKECRSRDHISYYVQRQEKINERRKSS